jgi:hypothetical protein
LAPAWPAPPARCVCLIFRNWSQSLHASSRSGAALPFSSRSRLRSASSCRVGTGVAARSRQGIRYELHRQSSHRRRIRRWLRYGNQGRIRPRHRPRRRSKGYRRTELPGKGSSLLPPWLSRIARASVRRAGHFPAVKEDGAATQSRQELLDRKMRPNKAAHPRRSGDSRLLTRARTAKTTYRLPPLFIDVC